MYCKSDWSMQLPHETKPAQNDSKSNWKQTDKDYRFQTCSNSALKFLVPNQKTWKDVAQHLPPRSTFAICSNDVRVNCSNCSPSKQEQEFKGRHHLVGGFNPEKYDIVIWDEYSMLFPIYYGNIQMFQTTNQISISYIYINPNKSPFSYGFPMIFMFQSPPTSNDLMYL